MRVLFKRKNWWNLIANINMIVSICKYSFEMIMVLSLLTVMYLSYIYKLDDKDTQFKIWNKYKIRFYLQNKCK